MPKYLNFNQFHDSPAFYGGGQAIMVELITLGKEANSGGELLRIGQYVLGQKRYVLGQKKICIGTKKEGCKRMAHKIGSLNKSFMLFKTKL